MRRRSVSADGLLRRCDEWNHQHPVGTAVLLTMDSGDEKRTKTRSEAWVLSGHTAVIQVEGVAGCYDLQRVRPAPAAGDPS